MTNEEFEIVFQKAIDNLGEEYVDNLRRKLLEPHPKYPIMYVSKEYYEIIKNRDKER